MAEAESQAVRYARMIARHVENSDTSQEVDFNALVFLNEEDRVAFTKYTKNNDVRTAMGLTPVRGSGSKAKHYMVNVGVLKSFLLSNNIRNVDFKTNDNNNDNNNNNNNNNIDNGINYDSNDSDDDDDNNPPKRRRVSKKIEFQTRTIEKILKRDNLVEKLEGIFETYDNQNQKKQLMNLAFTRLMKKYKVENEQIKNASVVSGISKFFDNIKIAYSGTIPKKVNHMKKSVVSAIREYSGQSRKTLKKMFSSVQWKKNKIYAGDDIDDAPNEAGVDNAVDDENDGYESGTSSGASESMSDASPDGLDSTSDDSSSTGDDGSSVDSSIAENDDTASSKAKLNLMAIESEPSRKPRRDKRSLASAFQFWHNYSPLNTNDSHEYCVVCLDTKKASFHQKRVQVDTTQNLHKLYLESKEYIEHLQKYPNHTIGLSLFKRAKCYCIQNDRMRSCADTTKVGMHYLLMAIRYMLDSKEHSCRCMFCASERSEHKKIFKNEDSFLSFLLCPKSNHEEISRERVDNSKRAQIKEDNLKNAEKKATHLSSNIKNHSILVRGDKVPSKQTESYNNFSYKCSSLQCENCGEQRLRYFDTCQLLSSENLYTTVREYSKEVRIGADDKDRRELIKVKKNFKQIIEDLGDMVQKYPYHVWQTTSDDFMRKLLIESGLRKGMLLIHTDFSAVLALLSQDSECCHHPSNSIQDVFVVSYLDDSNILVNEAYHFWGHPSRESDSKLRSNTAYHVPCLKRVIEEIKAKIFINGRKLEVVYILSDGCGAQYKNISNVFAMCQLPDKYGLDYLIHTFAPTSNFKCCCDACGADTKRWYRRQEMNQKTRCSNTLQLFLYLARYMPQPQEVGQARQGQLMKLSSRHHRYVCTSKDFDTEKKEIEKQDPDLIKHIVVVDEDKFYGESKTKTIEGITKMHQLVFRKRDRSNQSQLLVKTRLASCYCINCREFNFQDCLLQHEVGRQFTMRQILDHDSSSVLDFFGKYTTGTKKNDGSDKRKFFTSDAWRKKAEEKVVVVGIDTGDGDIQLSRMIDCPKKWEKEDEEVSFSIGAKDFSALLLKGTYYFPVHLLARLDIQKSNMQPNCYVETDAVYNIPLHCVIPPYLEKSNSQSADNGKSTKTFWNYIQCDFVEICRKGVTTHCIKIDSNSLRMLKNNTFDKNLHK